MESRQVTADGPCTAQRVRHLELTLSELQSLLEEIGTLARSSRLFCAVQMVVCTPFSDLRGQPETCTDSRVTLTVLPTTFCLWSWPTSLLTLSECIRMGPLSLVRHSKLNPSPTQGDEPLQRIQKGRSLHADQNHSQY